MAIRYLPLIAVATAIAGCGSMTGLTESSKFSCKAPDGVSCTSVSGVYANAQQNNLPSQQPHPRPAAGTGAAVSTGTGTTAVKPSGAAAFPAMTAGMPIRSQPRILRIWMAPWRDEDDTLHDQAYLYVMVDPGKWLIERSREGTVQKSMTRLRLLGQPRNAGLPAAEPEQPGASGRLANVRNDAQAQQAAREAATVPISEENDK